jgi:hypothetical protein
MEVHKIILLTTTMQVYWRSNKMKSMLVLVGILISATALAVNNRYVMPAGTGSSPDGSFTDWAHAATNIQDAVNAAANGDTVLVTNGTYYCWSNSVYNNSVTSMVTVTKAITVRSVNGPAVTIVDANYPNFTNRCFYVRANGAAVAGFTIANGHASDYANGGGAFMDGYPGGWCTLSNCWITGNSTTNAAVAYNAGVPGGGGVYNDYGSCKLLNCAIWNNITSNNAAYGGGGVLFYCRGYPIDMRDCVISNNYCSAGPAYAAMIRNFTTAMVTNCAFVNNDCGGLYVAPLNASSSVTVDTCRAIGNSVTSTAFYGGGISLPAGPTNAIVRNCQIINNVCGNYGGGMCIAQGRVSSCLISSNYCLITSGGGLYLSYYVVPGALVENCVIVSNKCGASAAGGGVFMKLGTLRNCLVANNIGDYGSGIGVNSSDAIAETNEAIENCTVVNNNTSGIYKNGSYGCRVINTISYSNSTYNLSMAAGTMAATNCCIYTNGATLTGFSGTGIITNQPLLIDYVGQNYRLQKSSPCVNAGINQDWMQSAVDLDGHHRINQYYGNAVDIGAYEYIPPMTIYKVR